MQVTVCKTLDIETTCEVDFEDVLHEFHNRAREATATNWRWVGGNLDSITKILAKVPDEAIAALPEAVRKIVQERLTAQAARYKV